MAALQFPCTIFQTQNRMDDYSAKDMRCGDLSESQLKTHFHLLDVSTRTNPYTLTKITPFTQPQSMFHGSRGEGEKITRHECARILFDEFCHLARTFAIYGPYKHLIERMITHMQNGNGRPFSNMSLDSALKEHIIRDNSKENSSRLLLKEAFDTYIDWDKKYYPTNQKGELPKAILEGRLPKFDRFQDSFNGMGITVHDTWATHITLKSLHIDNDRYRAVVHYKVQDHFGLDSEDILKTKFSQFHFFRIWFVLQRYNQFGFKPFMTNMEATVEITGERDENKKTLFALSFFACLLLACVLWLSLRPAEIIAVHENGNHSYVLVKNFPFTDKGKINWWQENKSILKSMYEVPKPDSDGFFTVVFWDFGDGYKEEGKYDRLCLEDMKPPRNCIEKDKVFTVSYGRNMGLSFTTNNKIYRMKKSGKIVKDESD